jgi:hypothetical protein
VVRYVIDLSIKDKALILILDVNLLGFEMLVILSLSTCHNPPPFSGLNANIREFLLAKLVMKK